jgi:polyhydroxyalkanoate synthesis regulator phasin
MAKNRKTQPLAELRAAVGRMRTEGKRLAGRIERDARTLLARGRSEILKDVRKLRTDVQGRAGRTIRDLERRVVKELHAATAEQVAKLERRVAALEKQVAGIERRLAGSDKAA